jgi:CspA family cold shock protein
MLRGIIRWYSNAHGYGFAQLPDGQDVFVHYSVIMIPGYKSLEDGQEVDIEVADGPKGLHATRVVPVPATEAAP